MSLCFLTIEVLKRGVSMDILKVFKVLGDCNIRMVFSGHIFVKNLSINDIVYSDKKYYIFSKNTTIVIPEDLEFQKLESHSTFVAIGEFNTCIMVEKAEN